MAKRRLLIVGSSYVDHIARVRRAPERGETIASNLEHTIVPGGFGFVSAVCAANLGVDSVLCSKAGNDEYGAKLNSVLDSKSVDCRFFTSDKRKPTGTRSITAEDGYKLRTIVYSGANSTITFDDIESSFTSYPDALLISTDIRHDLVVDAITFANKANVPVVFSCGNEANDFDFQDLGKMEIFCPNREQAFKLSGVDPIDANSALHASVKISNILDCKYVVIRLGDRGSFVFDGVYSQIIPAHELEVIDTNGAGNIFSASLACAYLELNNINDATVFANAAASFSVSKEGVYTAIPTLEDVKRLFDNGN